MKNDVFNHSSQEDDNWSNNKKKRKKCNIKQKSYANTIYKLSEDAEKALKKAYGFFMPNTDGRKNGKSTVDVILENNKYYDYYPFYTRESGCFLNVNVKNISYFLRKKVGKLEEGKSRKS